MESIEINHNGIRYSIYGRFLEIHIGLLRLARFDLTPRADKPVRTGSFRQEGKRCWAPLEGGVEGKAVVEVKNGFLSYTIETDQKHFDKLIFFPGSLLDSDFWHTLIWAQRDRSWNIDEDVSVRVGDTRPDILDLQEGTVSDPGDNPPYWPGRGGPRICAAHNSEFGWWGIGIPGPLPVCDTYFTMNRTRFEILFDYLHPGCDDGFMPTVYFMLPIVDPDDPYTVFRSFRDLNEPWRLVPGRDYEPSRFTGMAICHPWEALQHAAGNAFAAPIPPARTGSPFNSDFLLGLLEELVSLESSLKWHFFLPQGWFKNVGDFAVGDNFGGEAGFRKLADQFRKGGHLITVHVRLNHFNDRSEVGRNHPEWAAALRPGKPKPYWSANEEDEGVSQIMDITKEEVRDHLKHQVRRFLSDEEGFLNMDGIQLTGDHWPSVRDYELENNSYGVGDLLAYKINKELLLYGKSIKPYALISGTSNPLYGMTQSTSTMEDHLPVPVHTIQQLRLITNLYPELELNIASYCTTRTKALTVWPLSVAVGRPEIDNPRAFSNAQLSADWVPVTTPYRRRMTATLAAYANSPRTPDTINIPVRVSELGIRIDVYAGRRRTEGKLANFYSALSLGSKTVITYSESKAVIASTVSRTVTVPLPPKAVIESVVRIPHSGEPQEHDYTVTSTDYPETSTGVRVHIPDAAGDTRVVEIRYNIEEQEEQ